MNEPRLLVCDDEPAFGRFVRTVAERMGYRVLVTGNGRAFIGAYEAFGPTVVILDMIMPEMDGHEIVLWLAQRQSKVKIIIITGYTPDFTNDTRLLAEHKGLRPITILKKPVQLADLRAVLADNGSTDPEVPSERND